jgi:uncharacterized protein (DUF1778 family)
MIRAMRTAIRKRSATTTRRRDERLELRLTPAAKDLLRRAASVSGRTVSAYLLDQGMAAAAETLADRREFTLPARQYDAFLAALDTPEKSRPRLEQLLRTPSVLE